MSDPAAVADLVVRRTLARPPTLGAARLVCIDGPAGAGKTTLAEAVVATAGAHGTVGLVHMDDVYEGWNGLDDAVGRVARDIVGPLRHGRPGGYRRYDWHAGRLAEHRTVGPVDLLVLEGVGSGGVEIADAVTTLVWVGAPRNLRLRRGLARDGEALRAQWLDWLAEEQAHFARARTRDRAEVLVDGTGVAEVVLRT